MSGASIDHPPDPRRERRIGWLCAILVLAVWIAFQIAARASAREALTPWDVTALRHMGALAAVLPLVLWRGLPRIAPRRALAMVVASALGFPLGAYVGLSLAPVAHGAVILFGGLPIATALAGWVMMGERPTRARLVSLLVVAAGISLIAVDAGAPVAGAWRGDLCFLGAVVSLAVYSQMVRRWRVRALDATIILGLGGAPLYLPVWALLLPSGLAHAALGVMLGQAVLQGMITAVLAMFLYTRALNALGAGPPTLVAALVPGLASLGAWAVLGERLGWEGAAGVALASVGMAIGVVRGRGR